MIVTYTVSLRGGNGDRTITIPDIDTNDSSVLLEHILTKCEEHYNSTKLYEHDFLKDKGKLLILCIYRMPSA